jgi:hypothetical protein
VCLEGVDDVAVGGLGVAQFEDVGGLEAITMEQKLSLEINVGVAAFEGADVGVCVDADQEGVFAACGLGEEIGGLGEALDRTQGDRAEGGACELDELPTSRVGHDD